ncbi:MAG: M23 family metallopeptidase [Synergistes sp.]|nr:M23 family metallopeptidase [Synergistes sp.]
MRSFFAPALASFLILLLSSLPLEAAVDYQELQEEPLETAIRKLASPGGIDWDREEMLTGGAPDLIKDMKWPLSSCRLSRGFKRGAHTGLDLLSPKGTPIYAVLDGVVEIVSDGGPGFRGYGKVILINHGGKLWTLYSHNTTNNVKVGQRVKQGEMIATVGMTGRATANHLHFEVRNAKGTPLDPLKYLPENIAVSKR